MKRVRGMKIFSILLSFIFMLSFASTTTNAEENTASNTNDTLTIHTIISGDPGVILTSNASITLNGAGKSIVLDKTKIMSGSTVVEDVGAGTYNLRTKNIWTAGYSVVITLNGEETTSVEINPEVNPELKIEMKYTKQEFKDLPHDNLDAEKETDFYNPVYGEYSLVLKDDESVDDSGRLQEAIDEVNANGGGTLTIEAGDYYIANINMKSNVHIKVAPNVTFYAGDATPITEDYVKIKKVSLFVFSASEWIENVSIEAVDPSKKYIVDTDTDKYNATTVFSCNTVRNFKIADANILGDYKAYSKIGVGAGVIDGLNVVANKGVFSNIETSNVLYGYGLVQIQSGENLLFKDLSSVGGVTLRIENGFVQFAGDNTPRANGIYGRNISCKNGHYAFMCEDHGIPIGYFDVQGVHAESCAAAVEVASGNSDSIVKDVSAVYGADAQLKTKDIPKIPVELTTDELITVDERDPSNFNRPTPLVYKGPAIAAVILTPMSRFTFDDNEVKSCIGFDCQVNGGKVLRLKSITTNDGAFLLTDKLTITGLEDSYEYTGSEIVPEIEVLYDGVQLQKNKDYTLEFVDNVEIGTATVTIKFKREYSGNLSKTFEIVKPEVKKNLDVTISLEGDPISLATNARIMIAGPDLFHTLVDDDIKAGKKVIENAKSGAYTVYNRDIIKTGYTMKVLVNGAEENTTFINVEEDASLDIKIVLTKVGLTNLPCQKLNADQESDFYKPVIGTYNKTLADTEDADDSVRMQQLIDEISANGGGTLTIESGTYNIAYIKLKSNVHIKVKENVVLNLVEAPVITNDKDGNSLGVMFSLGDAKERISNVSFEAVDPEKKCVINLNTGVYDGTLAFNCVAVSNFKLSDVDIKGDYKPYSKVSCGPFDVLSAQITPEKGIVSNMTVDQGMYGYGLIQVQSAYDILFKDLYSVGGVTLRLENGSIQYNGENTAFTNGIYARNIYCKNGHFAVMCESHGIQQGYFDIQHVFAESCVAAANIGAGNTDSKLRDVNAIYGEKTQLKSKDLKKLPAEIAKNITPDPKEPSNTESRTIVWIGPSIAAVQLGDNRFDFNQYDITTCKGFKYPDNNNGLIAGSMEYLLPEDFAVDADKFVVSGLQNSYTETGSEIKPEIHVTYDGIPLIQGEDYSIGYKDNTKVGTASAMITFMRQYSGNSIEKKFEITKKPSTEENVGTLTIQTVLSGDPSIVLAGNARITLSLGQESIILNKAQIMSGTNVVEDVKAGTYTLRTKNIQTAGYSVVVTLNGVETTSVEIDPTVSPKLIIEMCYTKQEIKDLPCVKLDAEKETDFYNPAYGEFTLTLKDSDCIDDSERLQQAIDEVNKNGGGTLTIEGGHYYISNIQMKSNVHVKVSPDVTFHIGDASKVADDYVKVKKGFMFVFNDDQWIENVSIESIDPSKKYTIDLNTEKYDSTYAFTCNTVRNFKIADANILGDYKAYSKIGIGSGVIDGLNVVANKGVISNVSTSNVIYGYGLVQIQSGEDLLFKDISSIGGVTLRIENGAVQFAGDNTPRVNGIYGRNISCENGHYAFMCEDHGIPIGYFDVQGVYAKSCAAAVEVGSGNSDSIVKDVSAVYGVDAQLKTKDLYKLPVEITTPELISRDERDPSNFNKPTLVWKGPAIAAVILTPSSRITFDDNEVKRCEGFKYQINDGKVLRLIEITAFNGPVLEPEKLIITGLKESYSYTGSEVCPDIDITYDGVKLQKNKDYTVECSNNIDVGTANLRINFKRQYVYFCDTTFEIIKDQDTHVDIVDPVDPVVPVNPVDPDETGKTDETVGTPEVEEDKADDTSDSEKDDKSEETITPTPDKDNVTEPDADSKEHKETENNGPTTGEEASLPIVPILLLLGTVIMGYLLVCKRKVVK